MHRVVQITLRDGLMFPSGFLARATYRCVIFCRVPTDWLDGDALQESKLERVFEKLYGENWRSGNSDDSLFVVQSLSTHILSETEEQEAPWQGLSNNDESHYWFYHVSESGELQQVEPVEF